MPEPTTAAATLVAATAAVPALSAFGINLGLQPAVLIAGFAGALSAIVLLDTVPTEGDTWQHMLRTAGRRIAVSLASSLVAGYLTPSLLIAIPETLALGVAFAAGAGAHTVLRRAINWANGQPQEGSK